MTQPILTAEGIALNAVTYTYYSGESLRGRGVARTTMPNCIGTDQGGFENRNVANLAGFLAGVDAEPLHGDTLRVFLDLSSLGDQSEVQGWPADAVVRATMESVLRNAWDTRDGFDPTVSERTAARFVQVEIRGSDRYSELAGVYGGGTIVCFPSRRLFD